MLPYRDEPKWVRGHNIGKIEWISLIWKPLKGRKKKSDGDDCNLPHCLFSHKTFNMDQHTHLLLPMRRTLYYKPFITLLNVLGNSQ